VADVPPLFFFLGGVGPHVTQCGLGRGLPDRHSRFQRSPKNHNVYALCVFVSFSEVGQLFSCVKLFVALCIRGDQQLGGLGSLNCLKPRFLHHCGRNNSMTQFSFNFSVAISLVSKCNGCGSFFRRPVHSLHLFARIPAKK